MKYDITLDTDSNSVFVKHTIDNKKYIKEIGTNDFINLVASTSSEAQTYKPIISPLLAKDDDIELIQWAKTGETKEIHIFLKKPSREYLQIYEMSYGMCGYPALIFAITTVNKVFQRFSLTVVKDTDITPTTSIYKYPFSNVSNNNFSVCTGRNSINYKLESKSDFKKAIESFFFMPNTFEAFSHMNNTEQKDFRDLATYLKNNDYPSDWLVDNGTYQDFLNSIIKNNF